MNTDNFYGKLQTSVSIWQNPSPSHAMPCVVYPTTDFSHGQDGWGGESCAIPTGTCEPKCGSHGLCNAITSSCECEKGYTGSGWGWLVTASEIDYFCWLNSIM